MVRVEVVRTRVPLARTNTQTRTLQTTGERGGGGRDGGSGQSTDLDEDKTKRSVRSRN